LCEFGIWYALIVQGLATLGEIGVDHFLGRGEFRLGVLAASESRENLSTQEMRTLTAGRKAQRRIDR
jgi:hypothetical protein